MTDDEIRLHPDKVDLIRTLLSRLSSATNEMYAAKRALEQRVGPDAAAALDADAVEQIRKDNRRLTDMLIRIGYVGEHRFYCSKCKDRMAARKHAAAGDGYRCWGCDSQVVEMIEVDPLTERVRAEEATSELLLATAENQRLQKLLLETSVKLQEAIKYGIVPSVTAAAPVVAKASREIRGI
jgi:hypothetical protein